MPTSCEIAKRYLKDLIAVREESNELPDCIESLITDSSEEVSPINVVPESEIIDDINRNTELEAKRISVFQEIKEIYDRCLRESGICQGDLDNTQYCPTLAKKFLDFCKLIPIWSGIMIPIFGFGNATESSASSESLFKELKIHILKNEALPVRLDSFFQIQIESVIGKCNIIGASIEKLTGSCSEIKSCGRPATCGEFIYDLGRFLFDSF